MAETTTKPAAKKAPAKKAPAKATSAKAEDKKSDIESPESLPVTERPDDIRPAYAADEEPAASLSLASDSPGAIELPLHAGDPDKSVKTVKPGDHQPKPLRIAENALSPQSPALPQPVIVGGEPDPVDDKPARKAPLDKRFKDALAQWIDAGSHDHLERVVRELGAEWLNA